MQRPARICRPLRQRSGPGQDPDDKMLAINAEPRHKNMNLEKDLEDIHSTAQRVGGNEEDKGEKTMGTRRR